VNIGTNIPDGCFIAAIFTRIHLKEGRGNPGNAYKGDHLMRSNIINSVSIIFVMVLSFMLASNAFSQDMGSGNYKEGYGSYGMMGQDPDEIMKYGRDMMRYGFHESGMPGGSNKYPGYNRDLTDETIKKLNAEQEAFIRATEDLRQTIYEKELYLKAELVKKDPDTAIALSFQKSISEYRGKFEQKMIEHIIRMKKINVEAEKK
jgi:hypothetical protein